MRSIILASCLLVSISACITESRYAQDPDDITDYQHLVTMVGSAEPAASLVVDFSLAGSDVDEAIATATSQWGHVPVRVIFSGLALSGPSGHCTLDLIASSGRSYSLGTASPQPGQTELSFSALSPRQAFSTDSMTAEDAADVLASRAIMRASCEPLATPATVPVSFALEGAIQAERR